MKKTILIFCFLSFLTSCEIQYDGETKLVIAGKLVDENGVPIPEKDIELTIGGGDGEFTAIGPSSDLISFSKSDQNGNFILIFPAPKGDYNFSIAINNQINEFQEKVINARNINFENYKLDLDKIVLYKKESITTLNLLLNQTSTNKQVKDIQIEGKQTNFIFFLNPLTNNPNYFETSYNVIKNQNVVLKYTVLDYSNAVTSTNFSISIPINNEPVTYTITY